MLQSTNTVKAWERGQLVTSGSNHLCVDDLSLLSFQFECFVLFSSKSGQNLDDFYNPAVFCLGASEQNIAGKPGEG